MIDHKSALSFALVAIVIVVGCAGRQPSRRGPAMVLDGELSYEEVLRLHPDVVRRYTRREAKRRAEAIESARPGWVFEGRQVRTVPLPDMGGPRAARRIAKIEPYRRGFLIVTERWDWEPTAPWHAGIFELESSSSPPRPVQVYGCAVVHDVVTLGFGMWWLCRDGDQWTVVDGSDGHGVLVDTDAPFLRFGTAGGEPFLYGERSIYRVEGNRWRAVWHRTGSRLPRNGGTPRALGHHVYFVAHDDADYDAPISFRIDLENPGGMEDVVDDSWWRRHFGGGMGTIYDIAPMTDRIGLALAPANDGLWITADYLNFHSTLIEVGEGAYRLPVVFGSVDRPVRARDGGIAIPRLSADEIARQIPAKSVFVGDDGLYLAGLEGIAVVRYGVVVTPVVRFAIPTSDLARDTPDPANRRDLLPWRLARFDDGSFVLGDVSAGIVILRHHGDGRYSARLLEPELPPLRATDPLFEGCGNVLRSR